MGMKLADCHLGFIGFGHMAQIICKAIHLAKLIPKSQLLFIQRDTHKMRDNEKTFGMTSTSFKNLVEKSEILLLGVRPNQIEPVLKELASLDLQNKVLITIATGISIASYQKVLGPNIPIIRVMPNIAASVREAMSVMSFASDVNSDQKSLARLLFSCMGEVLELNELLMDISCAIAGSGPGFVLRLIESMASIGEKEGLSYAEGLKMSAQVFKGAAELILEGNSPETLLTQITVPGGTTAAGLEIMQKTEIGKSFQMAIDAAFKKSKLLGSI